MEYLEETREGHSQPIQKPFRLLKYDRSERNPFKRIPVRPSVPRNRRRKLLPLSR
jgi:hypothetical protein